MCRKAKSCTRCWWISWTLWLGHTQKKLMWYDMPPRFQQYFRTFGETYFTVSLVSGPFLYNAIIRAPNVHSLWPIVVFFFFLWYCLLCNLCEIPQEASLLPSLYSRPNWSIARERFATFTGEDRYSRWHAFICSRKFKFHCRIVSTWRHRELVPFDAE